MTKLPPQLIVIDQILWILFIEGTINRLIFTGLAFDLASTCKEGTWRGSG